MSRSSPRPADSLHRLRVLLINLGRTGLARYGLLFAGAVSRREDVEVLAVADGTILEEPYFKPQQGTVSWVGLTPAGGLFARARFVRDLLRVVEGFRPDVIHDTQGACPKSAMLWPVLAHHAPLVVTEHDPIPHSGMPIHAAERLARRIRGRVARHVFVHGPGCRATLVAGGAPPGRVSVIRHGTLDVFDRAAHAGIARRPREILFFGELRSDKGLDWLPLIADRVRTRFRDVHFVVAGSVNPVMRKRNPRWADKADRLLRTLREKPYFEVHEGFIPDEQVGALFRRASITLMPYRDATQSGVAMVAMPLGSVIVATRVGDLPFVIRHHDTGFLAEPDPESIADTLASALGDPDRLDRIRDAAVRFVAEECSWERIGDHAVETYRRIVRQPNAV